MNAQEKVSKAFQSWVTECDPPPIGMDISEWIRIVRNYAPFPLTAEEVNAIGREHWGPLHWPEQKSEDWDDNEEGRSEAEFKEINDLFNKLHKALSDQAKPDAFLDRWSYLATSVDRLHHDFAEFVS